MHATSDATKMGGSDTHASMGLSIPLEIEKSILKTLYFGQAFPSQIACAPMWSIA